MSKKAAIKEHLPEENSDAPIRRSSRILSNQTIVSSPLPKSIVTRRGSANSEKSKPQSEDTSPVEGIGRRRTRRTSTEEDVKSTPIRARRGSISKIIEEEKKVSSSPNSPSRKIATRAASTSPSSVPARRTRRSVSASQENEVVEEQIPVRRSTRRRSSVDTQEDASNEEVLTKSKPSTRRRRSTSVDESEEITKNDVKPKARKLYVEENQLDPIEENESEATEKLEEKIDKITAKKKKDHDLSVIEESEDTEVEESNKIIKDIDDVLSPPNHKLEKIKSKSVFSPLTPKPSMSEKNTDAGCEVVSNNVDKENEFQKKHEKSKTPSEVKIGAAEMFDNDLKLKDRTDKQSIVDIMKTSKSPRKSNSAENANHSYVTNGSDDSFTFNLNKTIDKTEFPYDDADEDVFTSPGSNKENSCINIQSRKNENQVTPNQNKSNKLSEVEVDTKVSASKTTSSNNFEEPMEVDCELDSVNISNKIASPCGEVSEMLNHDEIKSQEDTEMSVQKATSSHDSEKTATTNEIVEKVTSEDENIKLLLDKSSANGKEVELITQKGKCGDEKYGELNAPSCSSTIMNSEAEISFSSLNSNGDKMNSSFNSKSPNMSTKENRSLSISPVKWAVPSTTCREGKDGNMSSDISIRLVDTDEEDRDDKEEKGNSLNLSSKSPKVTRIWLDGTSNKGVNSQSEGNSVSESETTISAHTNTSMKESASEEEIDVFNENEHTESFVEQEATAEDSPKKMKKSHSSKLEVNSSVIDIKSKGEERSLQNSPCLISRQKDQSSESKTKENEFERHIPKERSPRHSVNKNCRNDGSSEEDIDQNVDVMTDNCEGIQSPMKGQKSQTKQLDNEEPLSEIKSNKTVKAIEIKEIKVFKSSGSKLENSKNDPSSLSPYSKVILDPRQSLNSQESVQINEVERVGKALKNSERKSYSRSSMNDVDNEIKNSNKMGKTFEETTNYDDKNSLTNKREKQKLIDSSGTDEFNGSKIPKNSDIQLENIVTGGISISSSEDDTTSTPTKIPVKKQNTPSFKTNSDKGDGENKQPNSDVESEKEENSSLKGYNSKSEDSNNLKTSNPKSASEKKSGNDSFKQKSTSESKIAKEKLKSATSPMKSKMDKMKACGVNFVNPSPTASRIKLDRKTSEKLDKFLAEKFGTFQNDVPEVDNDNYESESDSMSDDYQSKSGFLDDMADEGEEDTPSEGSNDINDYGESINSEDSEIASDDTYDSNDSFLVKDDGDKVDLLSGEEYDLEDASELLEKPTKKRTRIIKNVNTSSEEDLSASSPRVSFSDQIEVIPEKMSPTKHISPKKVIDEKIYDKISKSDLQDEQPKVSPKKAVNMETPSNFVDLIDDSSENEATESKQTTDFNDTLRSLVEDDTTNTPNTSINESTNTSKQNTSLRSSSIIVHENISTNEIKEGFLSEKLLQVVNVFCAGIKKNSDGNISMNVSLDYIENAPKTSDIKNVENVVDLQKSPTDRAQTKSGHSFNKSDVNNDSVSCNENSRKRKVSNVSSEKVERQSFAKNDDVEEIITVEDFSLLDASFNDENSDQDEKIYTESSKKKRRLSNRKDMQLSKRDSVTHSTPSENDTEVVKEVEEEILCANTSFKTEQLPESSFKKKRWSASKSDKPLNDSEQSPDKECFPNKNVEDDLGNEKNKHMNYQFQSIDEEQELKSTSCEQGFNVEKLASDEGREPVTKKKKKANKRKCTEKTSNELLTDSVSNKKFKLLEMQCEELSIDDLQFKLPSRNETSEKSKSIVKTKELKRLQSNLKHNLKSSLLSGLVTDVKNRPRRLMKPSTAMDSKDWLIEESLSKPSSANEPKCTFNYKKIDAKDFKNLTLYDPRLKREPTASYLRKKGRY